MHPNILHVFTLAVLVQFVTCDLYWGYEQSKNELGPDYWYQLYKTCVGVRQSPIDIRSSYVVYNSTLKPLTFQGYNNVIIRANVNNDGHTVRVDIPETTVMRITSPSLPTTYRLKQLHFHWGHENTEGSEHAIFGKKFPLEMHMVHYDEKVGYPTSLTESYGLLVVSVLFQIGTNNNEMSKLSSYFNRIADPEILNVTSVYGLIVQNLLPGPGNIQNLNYLLYDGSLTTPPCTEAVKWVILTHTANVTNEQMTEFRNLKHVLEDGNIEQVESNDRTLQAINNRLVSLYYNFDDVSAFASTRIG